jgi:hypothetical protein
MSLSSTCISPTITQSLSDCRVLALDQTDLGVILKQAHGKVSPLIANYSNIQPLLGSVSGYISRGDFKQLDTHIGQCNIWNGIEYRLIEYNAILPYLCVYIPARISMLLAMRCDCGHQPQVSRYLSFTTFCP